VAENLPACLFFLTRIVVSEWVSEPIVATIVVQRMLYSTIRIAECTHLRQISSSSSSNSAPSCCSCCTAASKRTNDVSLWRHTISRRGVRLDHPPRERERERERAGNHVHLCLRRLESNLVLSSALTSADVSNVRLQTTAVCYSCSWCCRDRHWTSQLSREAAVQSIREVDCSRFSVRLHSICCVFVVLLNCHLCFFM